MPPNATHKNHHVDLTIKILLLGNSAVGKTWLLIRYAQELQPDSSIATIGIDYKTKFVNIEGSKIKLQIWDTAGAERFHSLTSSVYRGSQGIVLIYDLSDRRTFTAIEAWIAQIRKNTDSNVNIVLVGNKCDVADEDREVSQEEGSLLAEKYGVFFFEASAKAGTNVDAIFLRLATETKHRLAREAIEGPPLTKNTKNGFKADMVSNSNTSSKGGCC